MSPCQSGLPRSSYLRGALPDTGTAHAWAPGCLLTFSVLQFSHQWGDEHAHLQDCYQHYMSVCVHAYAAAAAATSLQSCPTLSDPMDGSPPGSPVPGILQARTLEWVAISFSNAWKLTVKVKSLSRVWLFATPQTAAHQAPQSMGFSRQECWSGVPLPSPRCVCIDSAF